MSFSVVIPAFNAVGTLEKSVASALASGSSEIIVVDDGSIDGTAALAESLECTVIRQLNSGAAAARRRGIADSTCDMIILLDADDTLSPTGVGAAISILEANEHLGLSHGATVGVGADGERRSLAMWPEGVSLASLLERGHAPGPPSSFVWRAEVLRKVVSADWPGQWPRYAEDYEFLVRGAILAAIDTSPTVMNEYRWHGGKSSGAPLASIECAEAIRRHYAAEAGIRITHRSPRDLRAMVFLRRASELGPRSSKYRKAATMTRAMATSPTLFLAKARRRLRSRQQISAEEETLPPARLFEGLKLREVLAADRRANPREFLSIVLLSGFRVTQWCMGSLDHPRRSSLPVVIIYRVVSELIFSIELRPKTKVGAGLTLYHRVGTVVNDHTVIGNRVTLRHGTTIGVARAGGRAPVIEDEAEIGSNAIILGDVTIGRGAVVAAGAVVVKSVLPHTTVAGNPARTVGENQ